MIRPTARFEIHSSWLYDERYKKLLVVFRDMFVVRCEYDYACQRMCYTVFCGKFSTNVLQMNIEIFVRLDNMCNIIDWTWRNTETENDVPVAKEWRSLAQGY